MERLQKIVANSGVTSRRKAEELIKAGRVKVDGKVVTEMGITLGENHVIEVDGVKISGQEKVYYLLNKPRGVITSVSDDKNRKTVVDIINEERRIYPVGRLDYDTTGALLLTNDGDFANYITHPSSNIDKVYVAKVQGILKGKDINILKSGVIIDGIKTSEARVKLMKTDTKNNTCMVKLTIHEGHNHQVKKMIEAIGFEVIKLKRESIAFLDVHDLKSGEYRKLNPKEVAQLYALAHKSI